ncbi:pyocin knob domain-containing protein [Collinsella aerofaciens]|nr:pyocin knob domain-containing protein [Collinsella aerofaciens]MDB1856542.1 pyocin knob domain-containing protein [Collinsella aerofaciens]
MPFSYGTLIQFGSDSFENGYITQLAMDINTKKLYTRGYLSGAWSDWAQL